ncbi:MAG: hypothetical protein ACI4PQ_07360, partial [Butyricicoccaceae bacterium]
MTDFFEMEPPVFSPLADLCARLMREYPPEPCAHTPEETMQYITAVYPFRPLPPTDDTVRRFTLELVERHFPEELACAPEELRLRAESARSSADFHGLDIHCFELENQGAGVEQYRKQKEEFERRAAAYGLVWKLRPITVCMELKSGYYTVSGSDDIHDRML